MARNTRERILDMALALFNAEGEPGVATSRIADELAISPGNLHYHFRTRADLVGELFARYEARMLGLLATPEERAPDIDDIWLFLHLVFETVGEYRFLYRDPGELCARYRGLHLRFRAILNLTMDTVRELIEGLERAGRLEAGGNRIDALVRNIVLVSTFWLAFDQVFERDARPRPERAAWQVMSLIAPYLVDEARAQLDALAAAYLDS